MQVYISVNAEPLETAADFPYLGFTVSYNNSYWVDLYQNLMKAWGWWGMVAKVVKKTAETVRTGGMIYKELVQTVLLYVSKSWLVMGGTLKLLEIFHHWA